MYLYFDYKGTLLETVNDQALRQYNKGVNTVNIYIESEPDSATGIVPDDGKIPSYIKGIQYWFQLANGDKLQSETYAVETKVRKTIPFDRKRDLRHFKYGKQYEFFSFSIPSGLYERSEVNANTVNFVSEGDVFKSSGLALMTVQALTERINDDDTVSKGAISLERVAFTVEDAVVLPEDIVSTSEFNWLLQEYVFGDYLRAQLVYTKVDVINSDHAFTVDGEKYSIDLEFGLFNRDPKADDVFLYVYTNASGTNIALATVDEVRGQVVSCSFLRSNSVSIKGEKGDKGNTGMTPNITASATVNSSIGTPAVSVSKSGTTENPRFSFAFRNLKGNTGATPNISASADVDANVGTPSVSVSRTGSNEYPNLAFSFRNLKGDQGETGPELLTCVTSGITPVVGSTTNLRIEDFNRTPSVGESAIVFLSVNEKVYFVHGVIEKINNELTVSFSISHSQDITGPKGDMGEGCIILARTLSYSTAPSSGGTLNFSVGWSDFSRSPEIGDLFICEYIWNEDVGGINHEHGYLCICELTAASGINFTAEFRSLLETTGPKGERGNQGETGAACLILEKLVSGKVTPEYYETFEFEAYSSDFSRVPVVGDAFVCEYTQYNGGAYLCICELTKIVDHAYTAVFKTFVDAKGLPGDKGADGVGISSASVKSVEETEEYTSTTVSFTKTDSTTSDVVIKAKNGINTNMVSFIGTVTVDMWQDSTTYSAYGYNYSALIPFTSGAYATDTYVPDIVPSVVSDIASGNFAPFANSLSTGVQIYAKTKPTATTNFNVSLSHVQ